MVNVITLKKYPRLRFALIVWLFPFLAGVCGLFALGYFLFPPDASQQIVAYGDAPRPLFYDLFAFLGGTVPSWLGISSISFFVAYGLYKPTSTIPNGPRVERSPRIFLPAIVITIISVFALAYPLLMIDSAGVGAMLSGAFFILFLVVLLPANITAWIITTIQFIRAKPPMVDKDLLHAMDTPSEVK